jgi:hypothetical protein
MTSITLSTQPGSRPVTCLAMFLAFLNNPAPMLAQIGANRMQGAAAGIKITVKEGDGALNNIQSQRAKEPLVVVTDVTDHPIAGASVTFLLPDLGPSALFPATGSSLTVITGPDGAALGRGMRPNNVVGEFQIRVVASYQGQTARAILTQTNAASKPSGSGGGKTALLVALIGGAGAAVAVGVTRGGKSSAAPAANPTTISAGGSSFGPPR